MQTTVSIPGMHCESCVQLVKDVSSDFPEISNIDVDLTSKKVTINHDEHLNIDNWKSEIESLGDTYKVLPL